ncbi:MAG: recombinase family protein [Myxococcota bacterium]
MPTKKKRAAMYLRVSTDGQTTDNQRPALERMAERRGLEVTVVYEEAVSGRATKRPEFDRMMTAAHRGEFDVVLIWAIDRFGRSMAKNVEAITALDERGVEVVSHQEEWLTMRGPTRGLLVSVFSWVAEQEAERRSERTKEGLRRARREGKTLGRPRVHVDVTKARKLREKGDSIRTIAKKLKTSPATIQRALAS